MKTRCLFVALFCLVVVCVLFGAGIYIAKFGVITPFAKLFCMFEMDTPRTQVMPHRRCAS